MEKYHELLITDCLHFRFLLNEHQSFIFFVNLAHVFVLNKKNKDAVWIGIRKKKR